MAVAMASSEQRRTESGSGAKANNRALAAKVTSSRVRNDRLVETRICHGLDPASVRMFREGEGAEAAWSRRTWNTSAHELFVVVLFLFCLGAEFLFVGVGVEGRQGGTLTQGLEFLVDDFLDFGDRNVEGEGDFVDE